jgi:hypothetical protein
MRRHTGETPFECDVCQKRFKHASDRKRHMSVHSGEKRYSCGVCQVQFKDASSCRRHIREHTAVKQFHCQICSTYFKRSNQLKNHLSKHGQSAINQLGSCNDKEFVTVDVAKLTIEHNTLEEFPGSNSMSGISSQAAVTDNVSGQQAVLSLVDIAPELSCNQSCITTPTIVDNLVPQQQSGCNTFLQTDHEMSAVTTSHCFACQAVTNDSFSDLKYTLVTTEANGENLVDSTSLDDKVTITKSYSVADEYMSNMELSLPEDVISLKASGEQPTSEITTVRDGCLTGELLSVIGQSDELTSSLPDIGATQLVLARPDVTDMMYVPWHFRFVEATRTVSLPLTADVLHAVCSVWTSLVTDLSKLTGVVVDGNNYHHLVHIVQQLSNTVDAHLTCLQESVCS